MSSKPVNPKVHGIIDYAFGALLMGVPPLVSANKRADRLYKILGIGFAGMNALTDTPVGLKRVISFKGHQIADAGFVSSFALLTMSKRVRKDKRTLRFHLGFLALALSHYFLTDYHASSYK